MVQAETDRLGGISNGGGKYGGKENAMLPGQEGRYSILQDYDFSFHTGHVTTSIIDNVFQQHVRCAIT